MFLELVIYIGCLYHICVLTLFIVICGSAAAAAYYING